MSVLEKMMQSKVAGGTVLTPEWVAKDMLDLLPDSVWNSQTTFFDPAVDSGIFLKLVYQKLMVVLEKEFPDEEQ